MKVSLLAVVLSLGLTGSWACGSSGGGSAAGSGPTGAGGSTQTGGGAAAVGTGQGGAGQGGAAQGGGFPFAAKCTANAECASMLCFDFMADGKACTIPCPMAGSCPSPSSGCNGKGVCKPK